jgi:hypothetical protein
MRIEFESGPKDCLFHHVDGMYFYCTIDGGKPGENIFHLSSVTPMELVDEKWQIAEKPNSEA